MLFWLASLASSATWAVIFCGSNSFYNYRHNADSFYQYRLLIKGGIDPAHIILMCFDDIVDSDDNVFKGHIYRTLDHKDDIYPGKSKINYIGSEVTAQNFFNVITGNFTFGNSSKPVLNSTENDNVLIFYENHGGDQILGVPDSCGDYIMAADLLNALKTMHTKKMYKNLLFVISSCYSGSIAEIITPDLVPNSYFITSTNEEESSYAVIYDSQLAVFLSEEFSIAKDTFLEGSEGKTVGDLFDFCKKNVPSSTVSEYGEKSLKKLPVSDFFGTTKTNNGLNQRRSFNIDNKLFKTKSTRAIKGAIAITYPDVKDRTKRAKMMLTLTAEKMADDIVANLVKKLKTKFDTEINNQISSSEGRGNLNSRSYEKVLKALQKKMGRLGESFFENSKFFANLCTVVDADLIVSEINRNL